MPEHNTGVNPQPSPIERAREEIESARQLAGGEERDLTWEDRKQIVIHLSKAIRTLGEIERGYVPKEVPS